MNNGNSSQTQPGLLNPLTAEELALLERKLDKHGEAWGLAARFMGRMGLRVGEVSKLAWRHVEDLGTGHAMLHLTPEITKNGYARNLPIPSTLTELLIQHRAVRYQHWEETYASLSNVGLGADFLRTVDVALAEIERMPERFPVVHRACRRAPLRRFPYAIYFVPSADVIQVVACMHARRDPRRWEERVGG